MLLGAVLQIQSMARKAMELRPEQFHDGHAFDADRVFEADKDVVSGIPDHGEGHLDKKHIEHCLQPWAFADMQMAGQDIQSANRRFV